ncbi:DNA glycosylase [Janibacter sp. Soil728]|uniref:DNA-formamidopyrimidine glycosylase family protein n=1 Tax=Janibacter sp. Soil728 TaxID=1736393 RepID=UPI0006F88D65|nr:DNA-formamidopyrimidine glycosylase family protein [Janibacter sp. Soil728]KRE37880.1 DNA glycosylase [Janibacter sp. Soil728]
MPEGDTVWRTAQRLHAALAGRSAILADIRWGEVGEAPLRGANVDEVVPRGKHLLHRFDSGWTLHTHLRMEGSWRIEAAGSDAAARALRRPDLRAAVGNDEWTTLGLRLGELDLVRRGDEHLLVGHLGPDVLGADWDPDLVARRILDSSAGTSIAAALLDQRVLAGVGTFWASEVLFAQRLHPWHEAAGLSPDQVEALVTRVHELMLRGREHAIQSSTGILRADARSWVHGRSGRACRRCGETVRVAPLGRQGPDRVFFSCPGCQGGLAPTDDGRPQAPLGARRRARP